MAHELVRLANQYLYNTPILCTQPLMEQVTDVIESRDKIDLSVYKEIEAKGRDGSLGEGEIALIPIEGPLMYKEGMCDALCGLSSYQGILGMVRQAIDEGYTTIVYDVDSGGGQAFGCFETAKEARELAKEAGIRTLAYVDGSSASAAYALSTMADEIITNPDSEIGSVGVVAQLRSQAEKDKKDGVKYTFVYAGDSKIPYDEEGNFSTSFIDDLQLKIDGLYENFLNHVSEMRGIEKEAVRSTQAKMFTADKALEIGFVDKIMTRMEFANYLADIREDEENGDDMSLKTLNLNVNQEKEKMKIEEMQTALDAAIADKETTLSQLNESKEQLSKLEGNLSESKLQADSLQEQLNKLNQEKVDSEMSQRKSALSACLAGDKVEATFTATKDLDAESFNTVLSGFQKQAENIDQSELHTESGVDGEAEAGVQETDSVLQLIRAKKATK